jgi:hypothetical protein
MEMASVFLILDPYLIWLFRISGHAIADFIIGTLTLACLSLIIGEFSSFLASLAIKKPVAEATATADNYQRLSMEALAAGDRPAYKAANRLANEAFGKAFFMQVALSAAYLWPIFFVLAWMNYRFAGVEFIPLPLTNRSLGYIGVFLLLYIPAYISFRRFRRLRQRVASARTKSGGRGVPDRAVTGDAGQPPPTSGDLPVR